MTSQERLLLAVLVMILVSLVLTGVSAGLWYELHSAVSEQGKAQGELERDIRAHYVRRK